MTLYSSRSLYLSLYLLNPKSSTPIFYLTEPSKTRSLHSNNHHSFHLALKLHENRRTLFLTLSISYFIKSVTKLN